jgi:hypothetical protein
VLSAPVLALPLAALLPLQSPLAVHELGLLVEDQVIVTVSPGLTGPIAELEIFTTGILAGGVLAKTVAVAVPVPLAFLQVNVYVYCLAALSTLVF